MKKILEKLFDFETLTAEEAYDTLIKLSAGEFNLAQTTAFITVYNMRDITVDELRGFRNALLELCIKPGISGEDTIDLCGTGGDGKHTFNISTLASFIVAGAGYRVTKHGNYGVSSISGSSNVLEKLGYKFNQDGHVLNKQLDAAGICFMHAPMFHPALKGVGPIRRELGMKTFFNMLGPLVNPVQPKQQLVGVFNLKLSHLYKQILDETDKNYAVVYGLSGFDEISLTDTAKVISPKGTELLGPEDFESKEFQLSEIHGGASPDEAAQIFKYILEGNGSEAQKAVVCANAALAIRCFKPEESLDSCLSEARSSLEGGKALKALQTLLQTQ